MKTSLLGVRLGCFWRHCVRASATSGRSCSAARRDFFLNVRSSAASLPHQAGARRDLVGLAQPLPQLCDRRIRAGRHQRLDRAVQTSQPGWQMTALRPRRRLSGPLPPKQHLGNVRDTDVKPARNRTNRTAIIRGGENAFSQILRIRLPSTPKHLTPRFAITGVLKITSGTRFGSPRESSQSENALGCVNRYHSCPMTSEPTNPFPAR